jgi:CheY-like chemotaxis protein
MTAASGGQARQLVSNHDVDLLLLDAVMPGESGEQVLEDLRGLLPGVPVLLISGYAESEAMRHFAQSEHVSGFLAKPFTSDELATRCRQLLDAAPRD